MVLPTPSIGVGENGIFVGKSVGAEVGVNGISVEVVDGKTRVAEFSVGGTGTEGAKAFLRI